MNLKINIFFIILLTVHQSFSMNGDDQENLKLFEQNSLMNKVKTFIHSNIATNDKRLLGAFIESIELDLRELVAKMMVYGIDIDLAFIQAIKEGKINVILYLRHQVIDSKIIKRLHELVHTTEEDQDEPLKKFLIKLLDEENIEMKYPSSPKAFSSDWSKNIAKILKNELLIA